ncbi:hypothetical protein [Bacillus toyonensis]|uniref:Uncharacterized protein n=1 Tax=Bacillus toyonensis TaxID=155322 RepID=A0A2A8H9S9_9BACI|nr:hypothetical protein [Bacillus toyonensis]PEP99008.1 hypothetical protein CN585_23965 [Bacillus toyonensis]
MNPDTFMRPMPPHEKSPFLGRVVDLKKGENQVTVRIPNDMLAFCGIKEDTKVEVWGLPDGTLSMRIATVCDLCNKGGRVYEVELFGKVSLICVDDYVKLTGKSPTASDEVTIEHMEEVENRMIEKAVSADQY